jgi:hypothetical protein
MVHLSNVNHDHPQAHLPRSLENEENCVHLFSRNIDVDIHNYTKTQTVAGELKIHKSVDEGSNYYLDKYLVVARITGLNLHRDIMVFLGAKNPVTMQLLILTIWPLFYHLIFLLFQIPQTILLWDISPVIL